MNNKQQLEYLLRIRKIREVMVVKDNIHLTYKYKNRNQAFKQVENLQDKIINHVIDDVLFGNVGELKNIEKTTSKIINDTLVNERKRIHRIDDRFVNHAVKSNAEIFSGFFNNRLNNIKYSLQLRIEEELRKNSIRNLSDSEIRKILSEKYADTGKARLKNIVKDSIHTNESNISFIQALNEGYSYKVWMNGRSKGKTRPWHRARIIASVPIDEYFDIHGSYHAELMYPGDLNGGAENVANCRCWLRYTNKTPSNLKSKSSFNIHPNSYLYSKNNEGIKQNALKVTSKIRNKITRTISNIGNKIKNTGSKITEKVKRKTIMSNTSSKPKQNSKIDFSKFELNEIAPKFSKDKNKAVKIGNKTVYGVGESPKDKLAFEDKYGIKKEDLTSEEYKFIKLYSDEGYSSLNNYFREIKGELNPVKRRRIKKKYFKLWDEDLANSEYYISFNKAIKASKSVFKKGKILEESLVVVRRQKKPMTKYAEGNKYHSDSFLSTSISENVKPEEYGGYIHYIVIPKGIKIMYIEGITETPLEFEILFDKNVDLRLIREKSEFITHWEMIS